MLYVQVTMAVLKTLRFTPTAVLAAALPILSAAAGQDLQSHEEIRDTARRFAAEQFDAGKTAGTEVTQVEASALDTRLRLPACDIPLQAFLPSAAANGASFTVGVRCASGSPWTLYVPVRAVLSRSVVVATRALPRGSLLSAADLRLEKREVGALSGNFYEDAAPIAGKVLTRPVGPGQVLNPTLLTGSTLVRRGQQVALTAIIDQFAVRTQGIALADGAAGDRIRVRNLGSRRVVEGTVRGDGTVQIDL